KNRKPDRVGRRGLSEPREDFPRLHTYAIPRLYPWLYPRLFPRLYPRLIQSNFYLRAQPLESSLGRVPQAADGTCKQKS
ncbi:MAG: hypothetical protein O3B75_09125, partial [Planctomycetota bacterium]|nr:hypothetical protein [Planctomycetota bacterium]